LPASGSGALRRESRSPRRDWYWVPQAFIISTRSRRRSAA
jgi:hypothetical protein